VFSLEIVCSSKNNIRLNYNMNPQERAINAIRKLKEKKLIISVDIAKKQKLIAEIDAVLANFKKTIEDRMRLKGTMTGGVKLNDLVDKLVESIEEYLSKIDEIDDAKTESDLALATTFADSAADDVNAAIEQLGKEIAVSGGKKRKTRKAKKSRKTKKNIKTKKYRKH
jgi:hypothetical protein